MYRNLLCAVLTGAVVTLGASAADHHHDHAAFDKCAKECFRCAWHCEACATHCAKQLAEGKKEHATTLATCRDCAEMCIAAGRIVGRYGPMSANVCDSCAKACDVCGAACEKFPDDKHMSECAKACRDCAKACREMVKHAGVAAK